MQEIGSIICQFACYNLLSSTWPFLNHAWLVKQYSCMYQLQNEGIYMYWPNIWSETFPTLFPGSTLLAGPKHSTNVPFSAGSTVPLSVDLKEVDLVPNPIPDAAVNFPQTVIDLNLCTRGHSMLRPTLQVVTPFKSPVTVQMKVNVSPGQMGRAAVNCPATSPRVIG